MKEGDYRGLYEFIIKPSVRRYLTKLDPTIIRDIVSLLFKAGLFEELRHVCSFLGVDSPECSSLLTGAQILALDVETLVDERGLAVREVGVYAVTQGGSFAYHLRFGRETAEWLNKLLACTKPRVIIGHNILNHDKPMLEREGVRLNGYPILDTLALSLVALPALESHSLEYLAKLFNISYKPHVPDEDARASVELAKRLTAVLKYKRLLDHLRNTDMPGLQGINVIDEVFNPEPLKPPTVGESEHTTEAGAREEKVLVVKPFIHDSCCEDVWCPLKIRHDVVNRVENGDSDIGVVVLASAVQDRLCDAIRLLEKLKLFPSLQEAAARACEECCYTPTPRERIVVEARYVKELLKAFNGGFEVVVVDRPFACALKTGLSVGELLDTLEDAAPRRLIVYTFEPKLLGRRSSLDIRELNLDPVLYVEDVSDVSSRQLSIIFRYVKPLVGERGAVVFAKTIQSREACEALGLECVSETPLLARYNRIVVPTVADLASEARRLGLSVDEFLAALRETYPSKEIVVVQGAYRLGLGKLKGIHVEPSGVEVEVYPVAFRDRREALRVVEEVVGRYWGFELRGYQKRAVLHMLQPYIKGLSYRKPVLVVLLPTGSGKSVIFQSVALALNKMMGGCTIVVSPLLALIEDQVNSLRRRGVPVCRVDGTTPENERVRCIEAGARGEVPIIYVTPEQMQKTYVKDLLKRGDINYIVFDEAHCITRWGKSFRSAYLYAVKMVRDLIDEGGYWIPLAFFTATLSERELRNLLEEVGVEKWVKLDVRLDEVFDLNENLPRAPRVLKGPVLRDNIALEGRRATSPEHRLELLAETVRELRDWAEEVSKGRPWIGVVFVGFVRSTREAENAGYVAEFIKEVVGEETVVFHGQLPRHAKTRILETLYRVTEGRLKTPRIVVATKAFGMGVDLPCIRWIIHYMMSESIEDYYQEVGRGGRDSLPTRAVLLYVPGYDYRRRYSLLKRQMLRPQIVFSVWRMLLKTGYELGESFAIDSNVLVKTVSRLARRIREREALEVLVEKSLHVLSALDAIDYEIVRGHAWECPNGIPALLSGGRFTRICFHGGKGPGNNSIYGKFYLVTLYRDSIEASNVRRCIEELAYAERLKLALAMRLAKLIAEGEVEKAKQMIREYFEYGFEAMAHERVSNELYNMLVKLASREVIGINDEGEVLEVTAYLGLGWDRQLVKETRGKAYAFAILTAMLKHRLIPDLTLALIPYGYMSIARKHMETLLERLGDLATLIIPEPAYIKTFKLSEIEQLPAMLNNLINEYDPTTVVIALPARYKSILRALHRAITRKGVRLIPVIVTERY